MFKYCLIMAAGEGKRMGSLTHNIPKALVNVGNDSLISKTLIQLTSIVENIVVTCGHKSEYLIPHVYERGANVIINSSGRGNSWWVFNSLMNLVDEPVLVLPCDNITKLNLPWIFKCYNISGRPACMVVPVKPVLGIDGDYISGDKGIVSHISRRRMTSMYCSGIQVINPYVINKLIAYQDDFNSLWQKLIMLGEMKYSAIYPESWFSINDQVQLKKYIQNTQKTETDYESLSIKNSSQNLQ